MLSDICGERRAKHETKSDFLLWSSCTRPKYLRAWNRLRQPRIVVVVSPTSQQFANVWSWFAKVVCHFANAYLPVTSGANVQNAFSFDSAVDEKTRNKLYGVIFNAGFTYLAACMSHVLGVAPDSHCTFHRAKFDPSSNKSTLFLIQFHETNQYCQWLWK